MDTILNFIGEFIYQGIVEFFKRLFGKKALLAVILIIVFIGILSTILLLS